MNTPDLDKDLLVLAVKTKLIIPPIFAESQAPDAVKIGDDSYNPHKLAAMIDARLTNTPLTDLIFE
ncbi:MAG: hypothetical protein WAV41_00820 [Microgenomates group bacterium]